MRDGSRVSFNTKASNVHGLLPRTANALKLSTIHLFESKSTTISMERFILLICWSDKFVSLKRYMNISKLNWSSFCLFNGSSCVSICVWTLNAERAHINKQSKWASIYIHIYADTKWHIRIQIITLSDYKCVDDLRLLPYPAFSVTHIISLREFLFSWDILLISSIPKHQFGTWHFSTSLSLSLVISFSFYIYEFMYSTPIFIRKFHVEFTLWTV